MESSNIVLIVSKNLFLYASTLIVTTNNALTMQIKKIAALLETDKIIFIQGCASFHINLCILFSNFFEKLYIVSHSPSSSFIIAESTTGI